MGVFIGGEIYVLCCTGCAKSSEDVASRRSKVVGRRQGRCAEYKKCFNSTARVYLIGGSVRMPPRWIVTCPECKKEFTHTQISKIASGTRNPFASPPKPEIPQVKSSIGRVLVAVWTRQLCAAFWNFWFRRRCEWVSRSTGNFADLRVGELFLAFRAGHDPTWRHTYRAANQVNPCSRIEAFLVLCAAALTPSHNLATSAGDIFRRFRATSTTKYVYFTADKCAHMM